jgi:ABC-2 type transport system permease protein
MSNLQKSLLPVFVFAKISVRRAFRDKTAMFFIFLFPLIFLFIFGGIFGKNNNSVSFRVALVNESNTAFSQDFVKQMNENKLFKVDKDIKARDDAKEKMNRGQLDAMIVLPNGFGEVTKGDSGANYPAGEALVYYTQNNEQAAQALSSVMGAVFQDINKQLVKTVAPFTVKSERLNERSLSAFDYTFAGLLGFAIIGIGIFGPANVFPELKKQGVLRRLHTTPLKVWQFFLANVLSQLVVGLLTVFLMFAVAMTVFDLSLVGNVGELILYLMVGITMILGIGLALGGWAKSERQSAPLSNIVVFPMMFLSGTFFPRFLMPQWLQDVSTFLPLTPVIDGVRLIATEGKHLVELGPQLALMGGWLIIIYLLAFRVFRWE